jgi:hypothetical protein
MFAILQKYGFIPMAIAETTKLTACFFAVVVASILRVLKTMVYFRTVESKKLSASGKA